MTMITPSYLGETIEYSSLHACRSTLEDPTAAGGGGITLAPAPGAAAGAKGTVIGCGTCHTPHTNTYGFLRFPNTNSQMCLTCHDK